MPTRRAAADLNQIVDDGLYFLEARCVQEGIRVVRRLERDLPRLVADPSQLTQVLVNLTVNAMQAMKAGGTLTVTTRSGMDHVALVVEDTGGENPGHRPENAAGKDERLSGGERPAGAYTGAFFPAGRNFPAIIRVNILPSSLFHPI